MRSLRAFCAALLLTGVLWTSGVVRAEVGTTGGGELGIIDTIGQWSGGYLLTEPVYLQGNTGITVNNQFVECCFTVGEVVNDWWEERTSLEQAALEVAGGYSLSKSLDYLITSTTSAD